MTTAQPAATGPAPHGATPADAEKAAQAPQAASGLDKAFTNLETDLSHVQRSVRRLRARIRGAAMVLAFAVCVALHCF